MKAETAPKRSSAKPRKPSQHESTKKAKSRQTSKYISAASGQVQENSHQHHSHIQELAGVIVWGRCVVGPRRAYNFNSTRDKAGNLIL